MATKKLKWVLFGILLISAWVLGTAVQATSAGEIQVISSVGMKAVLEEIRPQFERTTGHTLALTFGTSVPLKRQIDAGETGHASIPGTGAVHDFARGHRAARGLYGGNPGCVVSKAFDHSILPRGCAVAGRPGHESVHGAVGIDEAVSGAETSADNVVTA